MAVLDVVQAHNALCEVAEWLSDYSAAAHIAGRHTAELRADIARHSLVELLDSVEALPLDVSALRLVAVSE